MYTPIMIPVISADIMRSMMNRGDCAQIVPRNESGRGGEVEGQEFLLRWRGYQPLADIEQEEMRMAEDAIKAGGLEDEMKVIDLMALRMSTR